ncbi:c-type cytochrome biogenesis protein CcmI [Vreelandella populi]|uniref:C-type cytochrome biogenesis protein CcmI n=1 Tax=Vreelandella populi TaxID=2498858 RepID=A0A3S0YCP8_9GAMM|nr:c-type cytochrome biogenesis protein CcmI [Halomonas populi]RUR39368.1 c-type cytochrome biogenesis protein CcmI [Halomonas populi]RUR46483.1 c-type cytochrome biogenesis protein CcmI [Halomonas populi]
MTFLWIAVALLMLPAIACLLAPLRSARTLYNQQQAFEASDDATEQNVAIFKRRLASLNAAFERDDIDAEQRAEGQLELERSLLEDTATHAVRPLKSPRAGRLAVPLIALGVTAISLFWYMEEGAEGDLALYGVQQALLEDATATAATYIARIEEQAVLQPDNPNVWAMLFPLYRDTGHEAKAVNALERLIALEGRLPELLAQLAQIRFFMAGRELTRGVQDLVDETLAQDPRQPTVLGLLGIHAFDTGDYEAAIDYWRRALATINDTSMAESLREGIRAAQERLNAPAELPDGLAAPLNEESRENRAEDNATEVVSDRVSE